MFRPRATAMVVAALLSVVGPAVAQASGPAPALARKCTVITVVAHQYQPAIWICPPLP